MFFSFSVMVEFGRVSKFLRAQIEWEENNFLKKLACNSGKRERRETLGEMRQEVSEWG